MKWLIVPNQDQIQTDGSQPLSSTSLQLLLVPQDIWLSFLIIQKFLQLSLTFFVVTLLNFCSLKILESLISHPACSASVVHQENSQPLSMFTLQETLRSSIPCHSCKRIFTLPHSQVCALKYLSNKKTDDCILHWAVS